MAFVPTVELDGRQLWSGRRDFSGSPVETHNAAPLCIVWHASETKTKNIDARL